MARIRHFLAVGDHATLTAAAAALRIRITMLISQLNAIERETGLELLQRSSGGRRRTSAYTPGDGVSPNSSQTRSPSSRWAITVIRQASPRPWQGSPAAA